MLEEMRSDGRLRARPPTSSLRPQGSEGTVLPRPAWRAARLPGPAGRWSGPLRLPPRGLPLSAPLQLLFQGIWTPILVRGESFTKGLLNVLLSIGLLVNFTGHLLFAYNFKGQWLLKPGGLQCEAR